MAKKRFTGFAELTRSAAEPAATIDREVLRKTLDDGVRDVAAVKSIRIDRIRPDPNQPRKHFDEVRLAELAESIRWQGILDPIKVQYIRDGDYFLLIDGQRRLMAAQSIELEEVPAIIRDPSADERFLQQLVENLQREDLNDVERALALQRLKSLTGYSWQRLADLVGLTKRRVLQLDELTELPKPLQDDIVAGQLSDKHARALGRLPAPLLEPAREAVKAGKLSGDQTVRLVDRLTRTAAASPATVEAPGTAVAEAVRGVVDAPKRAAAPPSRKPAAAEPDRTGEGETRGTVVDITAQLTPAELLAVPAGVTPGPVDRLRAIAADLRAWNPAHLEHGQAGRAIEALDDIAAAVAELRARLPVRGGKRG